MSICDVILVCRAARAGVDTVKDGATNLFVSGIQWLADGVAGVASFLLERVWLVFEATTFVDVTSDRFTRVYAILFGIAAFVMVGFFLLQVIGAMIRREPAALSRAALGLGKSVLGSFVALTLIATALEIVDRLCLAVIDVAGTTTERMGDRLNLLTGTVGVSVVGGPAVTLLLALFLGGLAVAAAFIVWLTLLVRKALLLVAVVFAPLALSGASWDATRGWVSRWAQFVVALIVSKLVMVVIFLLAASQVSAPIDADLASIADPLAGIVLLLVAGFAPYLTYKAISFMGVDFYHAMSTEQEAKQALNRPVPVPPTPMRRTPPRVLSSVGGNGAGGAVPPPPARSYAAGPGNGFGQGGGSGAGGGSAGAAAGRGAGLVHGAGGGAASSAAGAGAAGAATGGAAVAAVALKETATAGPHLGAAVGQQASSQADGTQERGERR
ncbi:conjugal transfer protein TrbL [Xylanimonas allomyrinae]|uniref:conjugal transfer protein TrbL n=1 Tax=Xylanimonas allomyrinae TaxID=2509459 RepID=UPI0013A652B6|nr:conjugal transfer protein TrbL [Xylanimonas allomyrinae]